MTPYFFLSYARRSESTDGALVRRFFDDLSDDIRQLAAAPNDALGFFDNQSLRAGMRWEQALLSGLGTARTFVALMSPAYFANEWCGREWALFNRRLHGIDRHIPAILPIFWVPCIPPPLASEIQAYDVRFGSGYRRDGLRALMEFRRHRDEYRAFVFALARRVVEVAETYALPPSSLTELDLDAVPNAFSQPTSTQTLVPARLNDVFDQAPRLRRPILSLSLDTSIDRG